MSNQQNDAIYDNIQESIDMEKYMEKKKKTFIDFLSTKHANQYTGIDDLMTDDFEDWLERLDGSEYIDFADEYKLN